MRTKNSRAQRPTDTVHRRGPGLWGFPHLIHMNEGRSRTASGPSEALTTPPTSIAGRIGTEQYPTLKPTTPEQAPARKPIGSTAIWTGISILSNQTRPIATDTHPSIQKDAQRYRCDPGNRSW